MIVAIDGPAGSGKSALAKKIAETFHFLHVDSGALFRTLAYFFEKQQIAMSDKESMKKALVLLHLRYDENHSLYMNGEQILDQIRNETIAFNASLIANYDFIRDYLLPLERSFAKDYDLVMDGRDIGSIVFPKAEIKFFLEASVETRAKRRAAELDADLETIMEDIKLRDRQDKNRKIAPLVKALDAFAIDTDGLNMDEVFQIAKEIMIEIGGDSFDFCNR